MSRRYPRGMWKGTRARNKSSDTGDPNTKRCSRCKADKPLSAFSPNKEGWGGVGHTCKPCISLHSRQRYASDETFRNSRLSDCDRWKRANPSRVSAVKRRSHLRNRYGLSEQDYADMFRSQRGRCAVCRQPENHPKRKLAVDHDHKTGKVRGLLCMTCNTLLGFLEKEGRMARLLKYLQKRVRDGRDD